MPPVPTKDTGKEATDEIARLNELYKNSEAKLRKAEDKAADEAELRKMAEEDREKAFEDLDAAMELAVENEEALAKQKELVSNFSTELEAKAKTVNRNASEIKMQASHNEQVAKQELNEDDTREIIDMQLRAAGWMARSLKTVNPADRCGRDPLRQGYLNVNVLEPRLVPPSVFSCHHFLPRLPLQ